MLTFPVIFTMLVVIRSGGVSLSIAVSAAFLTYWLAFSGSDAILKWIRKKWNQRKNQHNVPEDIAAGAPNPQH